MIECLLETMQSSGGAPRVHQCIGDHLGKHFRAHMMRTGKSGEQSIVRKDLECADVQLLVTAHGIVQAAFRFGERRRIENDQVVLFSDFSAPRRN